MPLTVKPDVVSTSAIQIYNPDFFRGRKSPGGNLLVDRQVFPSFAVTAALSTVTKKEVFRWSSCTANPGALQFNCRIEYTVGCCFPLPPSHAYPSLTKLQLEAGVDIDIEASRARPVSVLEFVVCVPRQKLLGRTCTAFPCQTWVGRCHRARYSAGIVGGYGTQFSSNLNLMVTVTPFLFSAFSGVKLFMSITQL